jgi:iron complex transport system permease protein
MRRMTPHEPAAAPRMLWLLLLLIAAGLLATRIGAVGLDTREVIRAVFGEGDTRTLAIVRGLRAPRVVLAGLCGAALALSGMTFQALFRNPLADPFILGVSSGAATGAVAAVVLHLDVIGAWVIPGAAFAGGGLSVLLVLRVATVPGRVLDSRTLLLAGVIVGAFGNAAILLFLTFADVESFRSAVFWMMGSLSGSTWRSAAVLGLPLAIGATVLFGLARSLNLLAVGEGTAAALGVQVERVKYLCLGLAALLAAIAVAVSGVIGFVGLVVPHAARLLWGNDHRLLVPCAALLGATFLILVDAVARSAASPAELPIGVLTAFVGVPFFIVLLRRRNA